jgi:hypothetical protein
MCKYCLCSCVIFSILLLAVNSTSQQHTPAAGEAKSLDDVALKEVGNNPGVLLELHWAKSLDPRAIEVNFQDLDLEKLSKADVMRVLLQCTAAVAPFNPTMLVFSRGGDQRWLMDEKDVTTVADEFQNGNKLAAVRMFAERVRKPTGQRMDLPAGLLARTTASFNAADEITRTADGQKATSTSSASVSSSNDRWKPASSDDHGPVVAAIVTSVRLPAVDYKDSNRVDHREVTQLFDNLQAGYRKAITNAAIAGEQLKQGLKAEVPEGSSELLSMKVRFTEILPAMNDDTLIPVTPEFLEYAPESTFAGITAYGKHGEVKGRLTGKYKVWHSGVSTYSSGHSYYTDGLFTDAGVLDMGLSADAITVKWGEIKNRIAFEHSDEKEQEDSAMEERALQSAE